MILMEGADRQAAPALGCRVECAAGYDTDRLGTFTTTCVTASPAG